MTPIRQAAADLGKFGETDLVKLGYGRGAIRELLKSCVFVGSRRGSCGRSVSVWKLREPLA